MPIAITPQAPKQFPLQLDTIKLYSTGPSGKIYTDRFYKLLNHNFGMEVVVRNNTSQTQTVKVTGCLYSAEWSDGNTLYKWNHTMSLPARSAQKCDFYVRKDFFSKMKTGKYKIQFWINGNRVKRQFFTVTSH